ncbi:MAG: YdeI/OmpD-associated family protein [Saprospiraceae bacterium]
MRPSKTSVLDLIADMEPWVEELTLIRDIIMGTELKEEIKWDWPIYTLNGKNVIAIGAFKKYATIWFHNGVFLGDPAGVLVAASEGTRGLRQWRFESKKEIKPALIRKYILETIKNQKEGKEIKPEKKPALEVPEEYLAAFKKDKALKEAFYKLTPGKQREYLEHVILAKTAETKLRRVQNSIALIKAGIGINDKYK